MMFHKFYTTQMSANGRQLQTRFVKMRSKSGRLSRIMAAVMAAVILTTIAGAAVVMAAVGSDGLEYWDKNEIYFRDGVTFSINAAGKNVPSWVFEDVAGEDGAIDVTITRYQTRDLKGMVSNEHLISLSGSNGTIKLAANLWSGAGETTDYVYYSDEMSREIKQYKYSSAMHFIEYNNPGYAGERPVMALVDKKEKKNRWIEVQFAFDEEYNLKTAFVSLCNADEFDNITKERFDALQADGGFSYIGNFEKDYMKDVTSDSSTNYYFTQYEDKRQNTDVTGIDFEIAKATAEEIVVNSNVTLPEAKKITIEVYNKDGREVAYDDRAKRDTIQSQYTLTPTKIRMYSVDLNDTQDTEIRVDDSEAVTYEEVDVPENQFVKGETYRICIVVFDDDYTVLYRWQEYVTLQ